MNTLSHLESEIQNDSDENGSNEQLSYGLKMRAADPRYITNGDDSNRGDMLLTVEIATPWSVGLFVIIGTK